MTNKGSEDEKFEEFVQREARGYNAPGDSVPREAMWSAIRTARAESRRLGGTPAIRPAAIGRRAAIYVVLGVAATLVVGVAIGRYSAGVQAEAVATASGSSASPFATAPDSASTVYQVATTDHLARVEALLVTFGSSSAGDDKADAQIAAWARNLLSNTRLLLDSPAANDLSRRRLLEDLERVLVQLVQRAPADGAAEERGHIQRSLERTQVLPRLRLARTTALNGGT